MLPKSIVPHRHAIDDVLDVVDYYREHAGTPVAEKFSFEVDQALERLSQHPNIGSPRPALDLALELYKNDLQVHFISLEASATTQSCIYLRQK